MDIALHLRRTTKLSVCTDSHSRPRSASHDEVAPGGNEATDSCLHLHSVNLNMSQVFLLIVAHLQHMQKMRQEIC